jgi:hypothetical protein
MQWLGFGSGLLSLRWVAGEHAGIRVVLGELETVVRHLGLHPGVRAGSVSSGWLRQYAAEHDKRGDDQ